MSQFKEPPIKISDLEALWRRLDPQKLTDNIKFQEQLIVGQFTEEDKTPTPVGALCLNIQSALSDKNKLLVYLRAQFAFGERKGGSRISSRLDKGLHTIEEKRTECLDPCLGMVCEELPCKQDLYMAIQKEGIHVRHEQNSLEGKTSNTRTYPLALGRQLVGEGASFALMRLLAIHRFIGQFETATLYLNGDICRNIYACQGPESGVVNGQRMDVCKVSRTIHEACGLIHCCQTTLTTTGRIIVHEWKGCDYVVYVNPMAELLNASGTEMPYEKIDWCSDLQLFSLYLDRKQVCSSKAKTYLKDRPEIQNILEDYVQMILQVKPEDVVDFTTEYFNRFSAR